MTREEFNALPKVVCVSPLEIETKTQIVVAKDDLYGGGAFLLTAIVCGALLIRWMRRNPPSPKDCSGGE